MAVVTQVEIPSQPQSEAEPFEAVVRSYDKPEPREAPVKDFVKSEMDWVRKREKVARQVLGGTEVHDPDTRDMEAQDDGEAESDKVDTQDAEQEKSEESGAEAADDGDADEGDAEADGAESDDGEATESDASETDTGKTDAEEYKRQLAERQRVIDALRKDNANRQQTSTLDAKMPALKPDLSNEPDWDDEKAFPTPEAAQEAKHEWYRERYQRAADAASQERQTRIRQLQYEAQQRQLQAEVDSVHETVRARMKLEPDAYRNAVHQFGAITHPQWNEKMHARNPVGVTLLNERAKMLNQTAAAGVGTSDYDTLADLHEANLTAEGFATKVANLPLTTETSAVIESAARVPNTVQTMKHLVSKEGSADMQRLLRQGTPPSVILNEVFQIAGTLRGRAADKAEMEERADVPEVVQGAKPVKIVRESGKPGRTTRRTGRKARNVETVNDAFDRLLKQNDKNGESGWRRM